MFGSASKVAGIGEGACAGLSADAAGAATIDIHTPIRSPLHQISSYLSLVCDMMFNFEELIFEHLVCAESDDLVLELLGQRSRCYSRRVATMALQPHVQLI